MIDLCRAFPSIQLMKLPSTMPKARGSGQEDQPHVQGAMAAGVQEGLEELSHVEGQEGQR